MNFSLISAEKKSTMKGIDWVWTFEDGLNMIIFLFEKKHNCKIKVYVFCVDTHI